MYKTVSQYERALGQNINLEKSTILFSPNVHETVKAYLCSMLGMVNSSLAEKYLGVPAIIGRNIKVVFTYIKDKVWRRLCGWNHKLLSLTGKEIILKVVVQAIPSFVTSVFLLPISLCSELESDRV